jgi:hypothetical protein
MFQRPDERRRGPDATDALVEWMAQDDSTRRADNTDIPAGFTYLGQFIDHDITFDPMSKLDRQNDPRSLVNFRTPRLDLDSVYGAGPADQPFLYDWKRSRPPGRRLLLGENPPGAAMCGEPLASEDLPRNQQGRALIGDPRNDENVILTQLHLLFILLPQRGRPPPDGGGRGSEGRGLRQGSGDGAVALPVDRRP